MNMWAIAGIIACALLIGGLVINNIVTADIEKDDAQIQTCSVSGNTCTSENNCGLSTCGATIGGSCGCGK